MSDLANTKYKKFPFNTEGAEKIKTSVEKHEILTKQRKSVVELFKSYSIYKGLVKEPTRLLDSLTTLGRVIVYLVPLMVDEKVDPNQFGTLPLVPLR